MSLNLETRVELISQEISQIKAKQFENDENNRERHAEVMVAIKELADSKADKWVQDAFKWILYTVGGVLILALLGLILIKTNL